MDEGFDEHDGMADPVFPVGRAPSQAESQPLRGQMGERKRGLLARQHRRRARWGGLQPVSGHDARCSGRPIPSPLREGRHRGSTPRAGPGIQGNGESASLLPPERLGGLDGTDDQRVETGSVQGVGVGRVGHEARMHKSKGKSQPCFLRLALLFTGLDG